MEAKRQSKRVPLAGPIDQLMIVFSDYPRLSRDDEFIAANAIDISSGGLACETGIPVEPLMRVSLMFTLPIGEERHQVRCEGYVAHSRFLEGRCVMGICFEKLSPESIAAIDAYIDAYIGAD